MTLSNNYKNRCRRSTNVYYVHILLKVSGATCFDSKESSSGPYIQINIYMAYNVK